jgi:MFS transporter, BCD family, chlorophyll transporter
MPFALLVLSGDAPEQIIAGRIGAAMAFLLVGAGLHTTQTAGLSLATDIAPESSRPRVVAFLYVMLMLGMMASALSFGALLTNFSEMRLVQVVQGAALAQMLFNIVALWKQEARDPSRTSASGERPLFRDSWQNFRKSGGSSRVLLGVGLGTAGFTMQDILLEPYGAEILHLTVSETTALTALFAAGALVGFAISARRLGKGSDPYRVAAGGALVGLLAFSSVIFSAPMMSPLLFRIGTTLIGFGGGLFAVGTLTAAMALAKDGESGLALGTWGAVQATAAGAAIAGGGAVRDVMASIAGQGHLGAALANPATGYSIVYHIEIALLFATLAVIGPLVRSRQMMPEQELKFGIAEFPG